MLKKLKRGMIITSSAVAFIIPHSVLTNSQQPINLIAQSSTKFPVVRSAELRPGMNVPWSKVVRVEDPFDGNYLAVFDVNYWKENVSGFIVQNRVITVWKQKNVKALYCTIHYCEKTVGLSIKLGDQVFHLDEMNGSFVINNDLKIALSQDLSKNKVEIRLTFESGKQLDSNLGRETVKAWQTLYQIPDEET